MIVFIISAPSGSGKSTLVTRLLRDVPGLIFSVSYTTRKPRGAERDGENYFYICRDEFEERLRHDEFLEWAEVFGNYYGTHRSVLDRAREQGADVVLDIDVQGAAQLKRKIPEAVSVFILPPSRQVLEARLRARGEDADEVIQRRLQDAAREISNYRAYDYVLINQDLEESARALEAVVRAERMRRSRMEPRIGPVLETFEAGKEQK